MTLLDILHQRLHAQRLIETPFATPHQAVQTLGAVQSQDYPGAKWGVGQRTKNCNDAAVDNAFNDGAILRTHTLRPTWHFVVAEDIRWIQAATAHRVHAFNGYYYRKLELDDAVLKKTKSILAKALAGHAYKTRAELQKLLGSTGIESANLRTGYILIHAELEALICSGPMRGKQHTYALVSERAPHAKTLPRDEAIAKLAERYFTSHGPALMQDFAWWSSLSMAEIKSALDSLKPGLQSLEIDGKTYYFKIWAKPKVPEPLVHLLPNYDEFLIAYKDRPTFFDASEMNSVGARTMTFANHIVMLNGRLLGGWRRLPGNKKTTVELRIHRTLSLPQQQALEKTITQFGTFINTPVDITYRRV